MNRDAAGRARLAVPAVLIAWTAAVLAWRETIDRPVFALSHDDFLRIALGAAVAPDNLLPSDLWPPLQAWITRAALWLRPDVRTTPGLVNVACALGALAGTATLAGRVGLGPRARAAAVLLVAALPWWNLLAVSSLAEPMATCAATWALVGMVDAARGSLRGAWGAALAVLLGGMVRYEAWGLAALLALVLAPPARARLGFPALGGGPRAWVGPALLPWGFPLAWMALETAWNGDPLFFATVARENLVLDDSVAAVPLLAPLDLAVSVGPLLALAVLGAWVAPRQGPDGPPQAVPADAGASAARPEGPDTRAAGGAPTGPSGEREPGARALRLLTGAGLSAQVVAQLAALAGTHNTARHYVGWAPALGVLAATALVRVDRARGRPLAFALGLAAITTGALAVREVPDALTPEVATLARRVATVRAGGTLGERDRVLVEAAPWECFALQVALADVRPGLAEGLDAVTWDRDPFAALGAAETLADRMEHPSLLAQTPGALRETLAGERVGLIATATARGAELAARVAVPVEGRATTGTWRLWRVGDAGETSRAAR